MQVGQFFLFEEKKLVLITNGEFSIDGRVSNFWNWIEINPNGLGKTHADYDNKGKFSKVPPRSKVRLDLSSSILQINGYSDGSPAPGVYQVDGKYVFLLSSGFDYDTERLDLFLNALSINSKGEFSSQVEEYTVTQQAFKKTWHPVDRIHFQIP